MDEFNIKTVDARSVAKYLLLLANPEIGDIVSNLKLQKLLYYAQGVHLAIFQKPLFEEEISAWSFGPVVERVYHDFKSFGSNAIFLPGENGELDVSKKQKELINRVFAEYGQYSGWKLSEMTHSELPWRTAARNAVIPKSVLKSFFENEPLVLTMLSESPAERRQKAAAFLLADYELGGELTEFSSIEFEDFYEMS